MCKSCVTSAVTCWALLAAMIFAPAQASQGKEERLQLDFRGEAHYSEYNFTDVVQPYDAMDAWTELRIAYWLDDKQSLAPYLSVVPVSTSQSSFWWQRNVQTDFGVQWYPFSASSLRNIRLFAGSASRQYYDKPDNADAEGTDILVGGDYYYDNLYFDGFPTNERTLAILWTNLAYRKTNFSQDDYEALLWLGNIKVGPNVRHGRSMLLPYAVTDWAYVPKHGERWWENYLRVGAGIRWYPKTTRADGFPVGDLAKRSYVYAEVLRNVAWLGDHPTSSDIRQTDLRIGIGFSTSGFLRQ